MTQHIHKKYLVITCLALAAALLLSACGVAARQESRDDTPAVTETIDTSGARLFTYELLSLPENGVTLTSAARSGDIVYLCGSDSGGNARFYTLDTKTDVVTQFDAPGLPNVADISADSSGLSVLSIDEDGEYFISTFSGSEPEKLKLSDISELKHDILSGFRSVESGYLLLTSQKVIAIDKSAQVICSYGPFLRGFSVVNNRNHEPIIIFRDENNVLKAQRLDDSFSVKDSFEPAQDYSIFLDGCGDEDFIALYGTTLCKVYLDEVRVEAAIDQFTSGIKLTSFIALSEDLAFSLRDGAPAIWTPTEPGSVTELTLATYNADFYLPFAVARFNDSGQCKIKIVDYASFDDGSEKNLGLTRLNLDIISGNGPDIIDLSALPAMLYSEKDLLEDLTPYFESDEDISLDDLLPSALDALRYKGGLYALTPGFDMLTLAADSSRVDVDAWGEDYFLSLEEESGTSLFGKCVSREEFLEYTLIFSGSELIDYENGVCHFDSDEFVKLLNYCATLPSSSTSYRSSNQLASIYTGNQLLYLGGLLNSPIETVIYADAAFGGNTSFVGFPYADGGRFAMQPFMKFGISSAADKEHRLAAWGFLKYLLGDEYQNNMRDLPVMPITSKAWDKRLDGWVERYSENDNKLITSFKGAYVEITGRRAVSSDKAMIREMVDSIDCATEFDSELYNIVFSEASALFSGDKSAKQVANNIQSRVSVYLAEQYG